MKVMQEFEAFLAQGNSSHYSKEGLARHAWLDGWQTRENELRAQASLAAPEREDERAEFEKWIDREPMAQRRPALTHSLMHMAWQARAALPVQAEGCAKGCDALKTLQAIDETARKYFAHESDPAKGLSEAHPSLIVRQMAAEILRLRASPQAGPSPEGWKLVPVEPTEAMRVAIYNFFFEVNYGASSGCWEKSRIPVELYKAMLAAAPAYLAQSTEPAVEEAGKA